MFGIPADEARQVLAKHGSSVEQAMEELFGRFEKSAAITRKKANEAQLERTTTLLERGFSSVDRSVIAEIVARHGGEIEAASNELLKVMAEQLERDEKAMLAQKTQQVEQKQEHERKLRFQIVAHCTAQFDVLTEEEVIEVLRKKNYDLPASVGDLRNMAESRKVRNLTHVFAGVPQDHIRAALADCNFDLASAFALLSSGVKKETPPMAAESSTQSLLHINPDDQTTKDLLAGMLRDRAGPGQSDEADQIVPASVNRAELDAVANGEEPGASLKVILSPLNKLLHYGESVEITVSVTGGEGSSYDWIGLFAADDEDVANVLAWSWYKPTVKLVLPSYGRFQARYVRKVKGGVLLTLAVSEPIVCGPELSALELVQEGDSWKCSWKRNENSEKLLSGAWFGLYAKSAANSQYLAFQYASAGSSTSSLLFKRRETNGDYEVRFFPYKFQRSAVSNSIAVSGSDQVSMERVGEQVIVKTLLASVDPTVHTKVWCGIFFANDNRTNKYRRSAYVHNAHQSFEFKCPIHTGLYEARVVDHHGKVLAKSEPLNVVGI